jgi:CubicO group peptidase (beta-lactamase class C family)
MSDQPRSFPGRPNLRYLKLEARRRLSAGEFGTLHDAQLAIAREHGLSSWAALKEHITSQPEPDGPALRQIRWVVSRFRAADRPAWSPPTDQELREHFHESVLTRLPADELPATLGGKRFRRDLAVIADRQLAARAVSGGMQIAAATEPEPPHRLTGLQVFPGKQAITDARIAAPSASTSGEVPAAAARVAGTAFAELGLVALALGGNARYGTPWTIANGWANLDRAEVLRTSHRFPVYGITVAITATAVLRLVADDRLGLDHPANDYLRTVRLADDAVTVRELLTRTGGVTNPTPLFAETVPDLGSLVGQVLVCSGERGTFAGPAGGYAPLGQLIADVTGLAYPDAAARLVLEPLGMTSSWFPASWPAAGSEAITGYYVQEDSSFSPTPTTVSTVPALAGLWATAADLVRFGAGWSSLLPPALADEALRPHAGPDSHPVRTGFGWMINESLGVAGAAGSGPAGSASLVVELDNNLVHVAVTSRRVPIEPVNGQVIRAMAEAEDSGTPLEAPRGR